LAADKARRALPAVVRGVHVYYVTWGGGWQYFAGAGVPHCRGNATLVCYEQLRAIKQATDMAEFTRVETEAIFHGNAAALFCFWSHHE